MTGFKGNALRVFGPPGCGKTTDLSKRGRAIVKEYGPESLMISSFSTTAAKEIGQRFGDDDVRPLDRNIGTLHSQAYRAAGHGSMALDPKVLGGWNGMYPEWRITPSTRGGGQSGGDSGGGGYASDPSLAVTGDELIACLDKFRATMTAPEEWPLNVRKFADRWEGFKRETESVDFVDMIDIALAQALDGEPAPGKPRFYMADEAQDMTPLEVQLTLSWGAQAEQLIIGMDDDQAINRWRGGDPEPLLTLEAGEGGVVEDFVLEQSYRVPEAVRQVAQRWVERLNMRRDKVYRPRVDESGEVVVGAAYKVSESLKDKRLLNRIEGDLDTGQSVMVIASCNYMLEDLITGLRGRGIPFHNPFRPGEARWNPLGGATAGVSTAERVYRYLVMDESLDECGGRLWTGEDVQSWMELVKLGPAGMVRGAKKAATYFDKNAEAPEDAIRAMFADDKAFDWATTPDPAWLSQCLLAAKKDAAAYPLAVARMRGPAAIAEKPRLVIGTIHSVKGAQADIVYVSPDISNAGQRNAASSSAGRDELIRLYYVAMTRAYKELRLLETSAPQFVSRGDLIPPALEVLPE